jgi:polyhydroxyalkanoate synthesis regulator phasin
MNELTDLVKNILYGAVGAVATVVEKSGDVVDACVEKGKETVEQGRATAAELKQKWKESCEAAAQEEEIDVASMTSEERQELRRKLDEADAAECPCHCGDQPEENAEESSETDDGENG